MLELVIEPFVFSYFVSYNVPALSVIDDFKNMYFVGLYIERNRMNDRSVQSDSVKGTDCVKGALGVQQACIYRFSRKKHEFHVAFFN